MTPALEIKVRELIDFAQKHQLAEVVWEESDQKVAFRRHPDTVQPAAPASAAEAEPAPDPELSIASPMVGTFRRTASKDHPPLVMVGNHVKPGDRVAIVESMKIPTDVVSFCEGEIKAILVEDGQAVEYGQPLFSVIPVSEGKAS